MSRTCRKDPGRRAAWVIAPVLAALALGACQRPDSEAGDASGRVVRIGFNADMDTLDPIMNNGSRPLMLSIFDPLTETRADGALGPRLATAWSSNPDCTVWTFRLRPDAKWPDGRPVMADDVVFTFRTITATATSLNKPHLSAMKSVERVGDHEVRFTLKKPFSAWPRQVSIIGVVPQRIYLSKGPAAFAMAPAGSGPYRVIAFARGQKLQLQASPTYWGARPDIQRVEFVHVVDGVARLNGLSSGDLDVAPLTPQQAPLARRRPGVVVRATPSNHVVYMGLNMNSPALGDLKLRQAMDYAINRQAITRYLLQDLSTPTGQLVASVTFGYDPALQPTAYDRARARALVAASRYRGQPVTMEYSTTDGAVSLSRYVAQAIESDLQAVGIKVVMRGVDESTLNADFQTRRMEGAYIFGYHPSTMDAGLITGRLLGPAGLRYFADTRMDELERLQQAEPDARRRAALLAEMWRYNQARLFYLPLFSDSYVYAFAKDRVAFSPRADGYILPQELRRPAAS